MASIAARTRTMRCVSPAPWTGDRRCREEECAFYEDIEDARGLVGIALELLDKAYLEQGNEMVRSCHDEMAASLHHGIHTAAEVAR